MFINRNDAGKRLAERLKAYGNKEDVVVVALPRGGVVVGYEIAKALTVPLEITCPRKIGAPGNPEFAIGAITETGEGIFSDSLLRDLHISEEYLQKSIESEKREAKRRLALYRGDRPPRELVNKRVILVDDGLATGSTMMAAIESVKKEGAKELIVAVPLSPIESVEKVASLVDHFVCLMTPTPFYAIGQFYEHFEQVTDKEVIDLIRMKDKKKGEG